MAAPGAIRAGRAFVELYADGSKLVAGLKAASAKLQAFGAAISNVGLKMFGLGAAVVTPMLMAAKVYGRVGDELVMLSERTGLSVEALSALQYAAQLGNVEFGALVGGIARMQRKLADAAKGEKAAAETLGLFNLKAEDLLGLPVEKQLQAFADRIANVEDPAIRAGMAMEVFGRGGAALLPLLRQGRAGIEALMARAAELGLVISKEDAEAAHAFDHALDDLWATMKRGVFAVGSALAPVLKGAAEWIRNVVSRVTEWVKANQEIVQRVLITAAAVAGLGVALIVLGKTISITAGIIRTALASLAIIKAVFAGIAAIIAVLFTPLGAIIAVIAALAAYWFYASGEMAKSIRWLGEVWGDLREDAALAFKGIGDALASGNIALAMKILWTTLKIEWQRGIDWLLDKWYVFKAAFMEIALKAWFGALAGLTVAWGILERTWAQTVGFCQKVWINFVGSVKSAWEIAQNWIAKRWINDMEMLGMMTAQEAADAKKDLGKRSAEAVAAIGTEILAKEKEVADRTAERLRASKEMEAGTLAEIGKGYDTAEAARQKTLADEITALGVELANLKKERDALVTQAATERKAKEAPGAPKPPKPEDINAGVAAAEKRTLGAAGTFEAGTAKRLAFMGGISDRLVKSAEDTAKNTKKIADATDDGDLVFG